LVSYPRVLIGKAGLDKHDRGAQIIARALRDAGYEVIYLPAGLLPDQIARIAIEEDVAAIGLSILSGAHLQMFRELREALTAEHGDEIALFAGGTIPPADVQTLRDLGVAGVFGPRTAMADAVAAFDAEVRGADVRGPVSGR
jgi:methylmalonyl-CoA mutase C-terminal domain/subunit